MMAVRAWAGGKPCSPARNNRMLGAVACLNGLDQKGQGLRERWQGSMEVLDIVVRSGDLYYLHTCCR